MKTNLSKSNSINSTVDTFRPSPSYLFEIDLRIQMPNWMNQERRSMQAKSQERVVNR